MLATASSKEAAGSARAQAGLLAMRMMRATKPGSWRNKATTSRESVRELRIICPNSTSRRGAAGSSCATSISAESEKVDATIVFALSAQTSETLAPGVAPALAGASFPPFGRSARDGSEKIQGQLAPSARRHFTQFQLSESRAV